MKAASPKAQPAGHADEGGSSSPVVPILIGLAVLAAISAGAFYLRQRHQRDSAGPSLSTKAG